MMSLNLGTDCCDRTPWGEKGPRATNCVCGGSELQRSEDATNLNTAPTASVRRQTRGKDTMLKEFNIAERGVGSYWPLAILRWVMVLIFISFGIQKFTPQSAQGIALYISNSPFVSWLSIFGIRGEADLLGTVELTTAAVLAAGAFIPILSA